MKNMSRGGQKGKKVLFCIAFSGTDPEDQNLQYKDLDFIVELTNMP